MRRRLAELLRSGAIDLVAATGIAGGAGYLLTLLAGVELGPARYVTFGVLWSSLFFAVGTLNGLQQEIARATRSTPQASASKVVRDVALGVASVVFVGTVLTSPLWVPLIFASGDQWLALPLALGLAGHTLVTSLIGMLHGLHQTRLIALAIVLDALLRFVLVIVVLRSTEDLGPISWALVLPYAVMPLLIWLLARRRLAHAFVDVARSGLLRHAGSTVLAAAASGAMISGISIFVAAAAGGVSPAHVGAIIFAINITRAPLIIVVGALQNLIVVRLRDRRDWRRLLLQLIAIVATAALAVTALVGLVGEGLIGFLLDGERLDPGLLALIVGSGGLVALMSVTGAAIIARGRHTANTAGWLVAALSTIVTLFAVPDFGAALPAALLCGPIAGLLVHGMTIASDRHAPQESSPLPVSPEF